LFDEQNSVSYLDAEGNIVESHVPSREFYLDYFADYFEAIRTLYANRAEKER